jgi:hypothetical protein
MEVRVGSYVSGIDKRKQKSSTVGTKLHTAKEAINYDKYLVLLKNRCGNRHA